MKHSVITIIHKNNLFRRNTVRLGRFVAEELQYVKKPILFLLLSISFLSNTFAQPEWLSTYELQVYVENAILSKRSIPQCIEDLLDDRYELNDWCDIDDRPFFYYSEGFSLIRKFLERNIDKVSIKTDENYNTVFYWEGKFLFTIENVVDREDDIFLFVSETNGKENGCDSGNVDITITRMRANVLSSIINRFKELMNTDGSVICIRYYHCGSCARDNWTYEYPIGLRIERDGWKNHVPIPEFYTIIEEECERFCLKYGLTKMEYSGPHLARKMQTIRLQRWKDSDRGN